MAHFLRWYRLTMKLFQELMNVTTLANYGNQRSGQTGGQVNGYCHAHQFKRTRSHDLLVSTFLLITMPLWSPPASCIKLLSTSTRFRSMLKTVKPTSFTRGVITMRSVDKNRTVQWSSSTQYQYKRQPTFIFGHFRLIVNSVGWLSCTSKTKPLNQWCGVSVSVCSARKRDNGKRLHYFCKRKTSQRSFPGNAQHLNCFETCTRLFARSFPARLE